MREHQETATATALAAGTYSGYSLHAHRPDQGINLILSQPGISSSRVTRLSPTAVWALAEPGTELPPRERPLQVLLDDNGRTIGPLRGEIFWSDPRHQNAPFGIQFVDVTLEQGRQILSALDVASREGRALPAVSPRPIEEALVDPERIRSILKAVCVMKHQGLLRQLGRTMRVSLEYFDVEGSQLHWRLEEPGAQWGPAPHDIEVVGYNSAYRLRVPARAVRGERLVTPIPRQLWRVRHRSQRRVPAPPGLQAHFHHPLWRELGARACDVLDVSFTGLSLSGAPDELVFPGLILRPMEVRDARGESLWLRGEVRYVGETNADGRRMLGVQVTPLSAEDETRWVRLVSHCLCPNTRGGEAWLEPLWELLADSGYFQLTGLPAERVEAERALFLDTSRRAAQAPQLFCQTVWPSERGVEGTLSSVRAYRHGWLIHQLARRPGKPPGHVPSGQILRDLHVRTLEHAQSDADFRWLMAYAGEHHPLFERLHLTFARAHEASGDAAVMPVRMATLRSDTPSDVDAPGIECGPADAEERVDVALELARIRPAAYVDALDLTPERLELRGTAEAWRAAGLERERQVLVARHEGQVVAAALVELAQEGATLSGLLDTVRLFPLAPGGEDTFPTLLDEARAWYAARERATFTLVVEREEDEVLLEADSPRQCLWLLSARLLPEFLEYVSEATVGRLPPTPPDA
ncbi:PilZ domain-containing protein [Archangium primigenium]|uniref:PilZ domain-containing protein n=1 Tax=[Archangium] primigenium TaxID=2792470 RepID=UPI00195A3B89|nr:PilZ domain-containing protein [Archangium primigenium]MBM7119264.1 PilZ domain-containing protein [Archangium primigenium]